MIDAQRRCNSHRICIRQYCWLRISMYSSNVGIDDEYWIVIVYLCICTIVIQFTIYIWYETVFVSLLRFNGTVIISLQGTMGEKLRKVGENHAKILVRRNVTAFNRGEWQESVSSSERRLGTTERRGKWLQGQREGNNLLRQPKKLPQL